MYEPTRMYMYSVDAQVLKQHKKKTASIRSSLFKEKVAGPKVFLFRGISMQLSVILYVFRNTKCVHL